MNVLIVDDSAALRGRLATMLLEVDRVQVGQAEDGVQAILAIQLLAPDAVILDLRLPGVSGFDVLRAIKRRQPAPLVVVLTNYPCEQYRSWCLEAGADLFFDKATEFAKVLEVLQPLARREGV
jgi:DNA-binding response OmpR family regulator